MHTERPINNHSQLNLAIEKHTPETNVKSKLPKKAEALKKISEQGGGKDNLSRKDRQNIIAQRRMQTRAYNYQKAQPRNPKSKDIEAQLDKSLELKARKQQIIQEELALLKSKHHLPNTSSKSKRALKSRETTQLNPLPTVQPTLDENPKNFFDAREDRKAKEEMRK